MHYASKYTFTGNTYRNRDYLRDMGATWDPEAKVWHGTFGGNGLERRLAYLRAVGVKITRA